VPKADIGCARAASGQAEADPAITLMNSRRCITAPKAQEHADNWLITAGIYVRRNGVQGSVCTAAIRSRSCPPWVKSRHEDLNSRCPLYPQKRTLSGDSWMSALCQKQTFCVAVKKLKLGRKGTLRFALNVMSDSAVAGRPTQHGGGIGGRITAPSDDLIGADQCQIGLIDVAGLVSGH